MEFRVCIPINRKGGVVTPSTTLEFNGFNDIMADEGRSEGKSSDQPPAEEVDEGRKGEGGAKDEESEPKPRKKTKPPTVGVSVAV